MGEYCGENYSFFENSRPRQVFCVCVFRVCVFHVHVLRVRVFRVHVFCVRVIRVFRIRIFLRNVVSSPIASTECIHVGCAKETKEATRTRKTRRGHERRDADASAQLC